MQCATITNATPAAPTTTAMVQSPLSGASLTMSARRTSVYGYGVDFGWGSVGAGTARAIGARFGASYLSTDASKNWSAANLRRYHARGLATVAVWETYATRSLSGYYAGRTDARSALYEESALGIPTSRPIYFAIDFPESLWQWPAVESYFRGVASILGRWRTGAYGSWAAVSRLFNYGIVKYGWQTSAWSGGHWDLRAQLEQYAYYSTYDWDRAMASDYGQSY
jgi:hypothetical protein